MAQKDLNISVRIIDGKNSIQHIEDIATNFIRETHPELFGTKT